MFWGIGTHKPVGQRQIYLTGNCLKFTLALMPGTSCLARCNSRTR
jgi:hypothetical protein